MAYLFGVGRSLRQMAHALERTPAEIVTRGCQIRLFPRRYRQAWAEHETLLLKDCFERGATPRELARIAERTVPCVMAQLVRAGCLPDMAAAQSWAGVEPPAPCMNDASDAAQ